VPPLDLDSAVRDALDAALLARGRLDGMSSVLPDRHLLLCSYVRKEAVLSPQIEGTQSTLADRLLFELGIERSALPAFGADAPQCEGALDVGRDPQRSPAQYAVDFDESLRV